MEGLLDFSLRDILTRAGGIDRCVSEFIRVTDQLLPERVFIRVMPELLNGGLTPAGVPVRGQLLGSDPACLADNAAVLASLGPAGIDLNFGCPAKTVNRHRGGAVLLDEPELLHDIMAAVRRAVPAGMPVSAKMRLGNVTDSRMVECAQALESGGAEELVVHGRTKLQGYKPPAYWQHIGRIRESVAVPVIANGEVWTVADAERCRAESGCASVMLGRGMVSDPGLAWAIRAPQMPPPGWGVVEPLLGRYWRLLAGHVVPRHRAGRLKQWLNLLRKRFPQAEDAYQRVRTVNDCPGIEALMGFGAAESLEEAREKAPEGAWEAWEEASEATSEESLEGASGESLEGASAERQCHQASTPPITVSAMT
jgi:tRNA-dihydrouridine synthase C